VASNYRRRLADRGIADGECGAVTVIQRANSDLRLSDQLLQPPALGLTIAELHRPRSRRTRGPLSLSDVVLLSSWCLHWFSLSFATCSPSRHYPPQATSTGIAALTATASCGAATQVFGWSRFFYGLPDVDFCVRPRAGFRQLRNLQAAEAAYRPRRPSRSCATRSAGDIPPDTGTFAATNLAGNPGMLYMYDIGTNPCSRYAYPKP
jgi:hypothetical protein